MPDYFRISWKTHSGVNHGVRGWRCAPASPASSPVDLTSLMVRPDSTAQGFLVILIVCPFLLSQYFIYSCILGLISCSVFLRVNYELKMLIMMVALVGYNTILLHTHAHVLDAYSQVLFQRWVGPLGWSLSHSWLLWSYDLMFSES